MTNTCKLCNGRGEHYAPNGPDDYEVIECECVEEVRNEAYRLCAHND